MADLAELNRRFGSSGAVVFRRDPACGGAVAEVMHDTARARIALKGAQVLGWTPSGASQVLWLTPLDSLDPVKAMRGGIPICWPWFADHPRDPQQPFHGLVRTAAWEPVAVAADTNGVIVTFAIPDAANPAFPLVPRLDVMIGPSLRLTLTTENRGSSTTNLTEALHTYFAVSDVAGISVTGLDGADYLDKVDAFARKRQSGPVRFAGETDRIYLSEAPTRIVDPGLGREIRIRSEGSGATVVWNAGPDRASRMPDLPGDSWRRYVCVETANAADAAVEVRPGHRHSIVAELTVAPLGP